MKDPFLLMLAIATAITTSKGTVEIAFPPYLASYGQPLSAIGLITSLLAVAQLVSRVPVGLAYRPERATRQLAAALVVFGLSSIGYALAGGQLVVILAVTVLHGFAFGTCGTLGLALAIDITGGKRAGVSMAWYTAAISLGYALGSILGGWAADAVGLPATMAISAALPFAAVIVVLALPAVQGAPLPVERGDGIRGLLRAGAKLDGRVWLAFVTVLFINLIWDSLDTFFVIFAPTVGITLAAVGVLRALKSAAGLAIRLTGALVLQVADHRRITLAGVVIAAVSMVALPVSNAMPVLIAIFIALGLARGIVRATSAATIAELRAEGRDVGLASGVYNAGLDIGSIAGPTVGGAIATLVGIPQMFQIVGIIGLAVWLAVALSSAPTRRAAGLARRNVIPFGASASEDPALPVRASPQERSG
jgi:MFS family permease